MAGDARYFKDPITAHGISDAFADAEGLAEAIAKGLEDVEAMEPALVAFEKSRNRESQPALELTLLCAQLAPLPEPTVLVYRAAIGDPQAAARVMAVIGGSLPWAEVFATAVPG